MGHGGHGEIDLDEPELCSSESECAVVDAPSSVEKRPKGSTSAPAAKKHQKSKSCTGGPRLPPGWIKVASKSHPGAFYYAHPASKRTQTQPPKAMYSGLPEPTDTEPKTLLGTPLPGAQVKKAAEEAKEAKEAKAREEAAKAQRAREEALRKQQERKEKLKKAEEEAKVETLAAEEVIRRAREKRAADSQSQFEAPAASRPKRSEKKAAGVRFDRSKQDDTAQSESEESEELDLEKLKKKFRAKVEERNLALIPDLDFCEEPAPPPPPPPPLAPLPPPPLVEEHAAPMEVKMDKKDEKKMKRKAKEQELKAMKLSMTKEEKKRFKKIRKMQKLQAKVAKAEKALKKSEKMLKNSKHDASSSSSSSSCSSSS